MANLNFNSKETYLVARAEWKAEYKELSQNIRDARSAFNEAQRVFGKVGSYKWHLGAGSPENAAYNAAWRAVDDARILRYKLRNEATSMLGDLVEMQNEACRQWEEKHLAVAS